MIYLFENVFPFFLFLRLGPVVPPTPARCEGGCRQSRERAVNMGPVLWGLSAMAMGVARILAKGVSDS
jgi:hypothetical protein